MALVLADRVKETTTTTGTGTLTLAGAATGFQSFSVIGNGNTTYYAISSSSGTEWEVGIGTYTLSGTTLARTTILASSNSGSAVNLSAGTKDVFVTLPSSKAIATATTVSDTANSSTGYFQNPSGTTAQRPSSPIAGMTRFNTSRSNLEIYNGTIWQAFTVTAADTYSASYLIVAGGGGGGAAGGGAGGLLSGSSTLTTGTTYSFAIGAGGTGNPSSGNAATNGADSTGLSLTAVGGGYGSTQNTNNGNGGSGGGGWASGGSSKDGGTGTSGQGYAGGSGTGDGGGGGGGAGAVGGNGASGTSGAGGVGVVTTLITTTQATSASVGQVVSSSVYFAGGGGAGYPGAAGGSGGGGTGRTGGTQGDAGTTNTGGGGGGGQSWYGGNGGSGCVIISVPTANYSSTTTGSPTVVTNGSNTVMIFKSAGSYTA